MESIPETRAYSWQQWVCMRFFILFIFLQRNKLQDFCDKTRVTDVSVIDAGKSLCVSCKDPKMF